MTEKACHLSKKVVLTYKESAKHQELLRFIFFLNPHYKGQEISIW